MTILYHASRRGGIGTKRPVSSKMRRIVSRKPTGGYRNDDIKAASDKIIVSRKPTGGYRNAQVIRQSKLLIVSRKPTGGYRN